MEIEHKNDIDCPVKDLLSLIRQDDIAQLRDALLDVIDKSHPGGEIYLYEHGYSLYESYNKRFAPKLLACRGLSDKCVENAQLIQLSSDADSIHFDGFKYLPTDDYVQVFTVESERSSRGLLITINKKIIDEHYIHTLLSAYNHQVHLLRNKDTDSLTGLFNRQSFDSKLTKLHSNFGSEKRSDDEPCTYCFALLDIDFFKAVNDKFGHIYGGEEFNFPMENKVTESIGYCEFNNLMPLTSIIERADKALYHSKENGRNMVCGFEPLLKQNKIQDLIIDEGDIELF